MGGILAELDVGMTAGYAVDADSSTTVRRMVFVHLDQATAAVPVVRVNSSRLVVG